MTSVMNAVVDALRDVGINHFDMPASPPRVWAAIRKASASESPRPAALHPRRLGAEGQAE